MSLSLNGGGGAIRRPRTSGIQDPGFNSSTDYNSDAQQQQQQQQRSEIGNIPRARSSTAYDSSMRGPMQSLMTDRFSSAQEWKGIASAASTNHNNNGQAAASFRVVNASKASTLVAPSPHQNEASMSRDEILRQNEFLKDLVHRLNVELANYQTKYPNFLNDGGNRNQMAGLSDSDPTPQWLIQAEYLNPLLVAYDSKIMELSGFTKQAQDELAETKEKLKTIITENENLYEELRELTEKANERAKREDDEESPKKALKKRERLDLNEQERVEMTKRLDLLSEENEILLQQHKAHLKEIEKLRSDLVNKSKEVFQSNQELVLFRKNYTSLVENHNSLKMGNKDLQDEYERLTSAWKTLQHEHEIKDSDLQRTLRENKGLQGKLNDFQRSLEDTSRQCQDYQRQISTQKQVEKDLQHQIRSLELMVADLKGKLERKLDDSDRLAQDNMELSSASKSIEKRFKAMEEKELEAFQTVQKSIERVEQLMLERDKALALESQAQLEIQRLNDRLAQTQLKWREKMEEEINAIRGQWLNERKNWKIEATQSNLKVAELQQMVERAKREKRAVESELEKVQSVPEREQNRLSQLVEHLQAQLRGITRERDELLANFTSFQLKATREENRMEKEKETMVCQMDEMYRRLRRLEKEYEDSKEDKVKMQNTITELEHDLHRVEEAKTILEKQGLAELSAVQRKYEAEKKSLTQKYQEIYEQYGKASRELQEVLGKQHLLSDRWKDESKSNADQYERIVRDLTAKFKDVQGQYNQVKDELQRVTSLKDELMKQVAEERRTQVKVHGYLRESENKLTEKIQQVEKLISAESSHLLEKRELQRQLDKATLERDRLQRELNVTLETAALTMPVTASSIYNNTSFGGINRKHKNANNLINNQNYQKDAYHRKSSVQKQGANDDHLRLDELETRSAMGMNQNTSQEVINLKFDPNEAITNANRLLEEFNELSVTEDSNINDAGNNETNDNNNYNEDDFEEEEEERALQEQIDRINKLANAATATA